MSASQSLIRNRRILITDGRGPAALAALRSLGRAGACVALGWTEGAPRPDACWSRYGESLVEHPDPWSGQNRFIDWLVNGINAKRWDAIVPLGDASVAAVARLRRRFPGAPVICAIPPEPSLEFSQSRLRAAKLAESLGISIPPTVFISDGDASQTWNQDFASMSFPIAIRIDPHLDAAGAFVRGRDLLAPDADAARSMLRELAGLRTGIIAQELVPGSGFEAAFVKRGSAWPLAFALRRLHEAPWSGGRPALTVSYRNAKLLDLGRRMLEAAGCEGAAMVEFRLNTRDNKFYFIRIVSRLWSSLALALHAGADFPKIYLEGLFQDAALAAEAARGAKTKSPAPVAAADPLLTAEYPAGMRCQTLLTGEIDYLRSVVAAKAPVQGKRPPSIGKAFRETAFAALDPRVRHTHLWWTDPLPGVAAAVRCGASLFGGREESPPPARPDSA